HDDRLLAKTESGLIQFDMKGNIIRQMNKAFGFASNRIIDFDVSDSNLWISHSGGLQKLNLHQLKDSLAKPSIRIANLLVNDQLVSMKDKNGYENNQRKFQFILSSPTLKNRDNITYHYKLKGYETNWTIADYVHNQITYNALAPGSYTFVAKAENQGSFSEPVKYSFTISAPFYIRWW